MIFEQPRFVNRSHVRWKKNQRVAALTQNSHLSLWHEYTHKYTRVITGQGDTNKTVLDYNVLHIFRPERTTMERIHGITLRPPGEGG